MKKLQYKPQKRAGKVAGVVSAAALMLGVSHAATVGFNFQVNYCSSAGYSGAVVTAPAFGIGTNGWESLTPMDTGYGCTNGCGFTTLSETISTNTSSGGLNPLPSGSLSVTWGAYAANASGFGGYSRPGPYYTFGGNNEQPGNEQVYWGFLRDGVNFGPVPGTCAFNGTGDNNEPGWNVDITGLKSLFTNSPFVVQIIAAGDSIYNLTNVFVIDATLSTTQSVSYPNIAPVADQHNTPWPRGIGGGLSTASGAVNTDHLQLVGNRAEHSAGPPAFNNASQVCGFIITDKPVVTMSPQPALVGAGDNVTLRVLAIGVPPLSVQWRSGGVPIPGATNLSYNIPSARVSANYDLVVTNLYGSATSTVAAVTVDSVAMNRGPNYTPDSKPSGTPHDGLLLNATIAASSTDGNGTNRLGVAQFAAADPDQITVSGATTDFDSTNGTIMFWARSAGTPLTNGTIGAILFDRLTTGGGGLQIIQIDSGNIGVQTPGGNTSTGGNINDDNWHHFAVTYNITNGTAQCYFDGNVDSAMTAAPWTWPVGQEIELGKSHTTSWEAYDGQMDDVRIYNRQLTAGEVASVFANDALVDTTALKLRLNFGSTKLPGVTVSWQLATDVLQSANFVTGPYTDVPSATSPYRIEPQSTQKYYRYRHTAAVIVTNPYDM